MRDWHGGCFQFSAFAARPDVWAGPDRSNAGGAANLVAFQQRLAREDRALTHTIIQPTIDKATDSAILANTVTLHTVGKKRRGHRHAGRTDLGHSRALRR